MTIEFETVSALNAENISESSWLWERIYTETTDAMLAIWVPVAPLAERMNEPNLPQASKEEEYYYYMVGDHDGSPEFIEQEHYGDGITVHQFKQPKNWCFAPDAIKEYRRQKDEGRYDPDERRGGLTPRWAS